MQNLTTQLEELSQKLTSQEQEQSGKISDLQTQLEQATHEKELAAEQNR